MPTRDHFDILAPIYDRVIRPPDVADLARLLGLPFAGRLLDAGGGTGRIAQALLGRAGSICVADASRKMLARARSKNGLAPVAARAERLPFAAGAFGRVVMVDALHHVRRQSEGLRDLWRVLAPGGRLVIEEPDIRRAAVRLVALAEKLAGMRSRIAPGEEIAAQLAGLGGRVTVERQGHAVRVAVEKPPI